MSNRTPAGLVWLFHGEGAAFAGGVFSTRASAEGWIRDRRLSGILTAYPVDVGVYDWAVAAGHFHPRHEKHSTPAFVGWFTSAAQEHYHYVDGAPAR
jgi:hypothetical protein